VTRGGAGPAVSALALGPDRRILAVGRETGGIELWDLGTRKLLFTLVVAGARSTVVTPQGQLDGDPQLLARSATVQPGLARRLLSELAPPIAIAPTPAAVVQPRGCLPKQLDPSMHPTFAAFAGTTLSYCIGGHDDDDAPFCFAADLATAEVTPIAAPLRVLAPREAASEATPGGASVERDAASGGIKACPHPDHCVMLPAGAGSDLAISDDGTLVAVGDRQGIETWDVSAGKRLARFAVPRWRGKVDGERRPLFVGHLVLALDNPCAGPCGVATMYGSRGQQLGTFPGEASEAITRRFHDELWIVTHGEFRGFAILDTRTGAVLHQSRAREALVAVTAERVGVVLGADLLREPFVPEQIGEVQVYDRAARLTAKLQTPRCR
jgi:hypothetical protein